MINIHSFMPEYFIPNAVR